MKINYLIEKTTPLPFPAKLWLNEINDGHFWAEKAHASFPSPAKDVLDASLNINEVVMRNPESTFFMEVSGNCMIRAGIFDGDFIAIDRSLPVDSGDIVVAIYNGSFVVKRLVKEKSDLYLKSESRNTRRILVRNYKDLKIWGKVTYVLHKL